MLLRATTCLEGSAWSAAPPATHPGVELSANLKSISHRCYLFEVAYVRELTQETIVLPLGCLRAALPGPPGLPPIHPALAPPPFPPTSLFLHQPTGVPLTSTSGHRHLLPPPFQTLTARTHTHQPPPYVLSRPRHPTHNRSVPTSHSFFLFFTLVSGPRRSLSLKLSDTRVYEPQIRARLGTTAHFCEVVVLKLRAVPSTPPSGAAGGRLSP